MADVITILLAACNGEKYIRRQVDSILSQTYTNWHLIIRDDGSKDDTRNIIQSYRQRYPQKIDVMLNNGSNKGSLPNFSALLQASAGADYIMFCDQDDEWKEDKIEISFTKLKELERTHGQNHPILIFTNFQYVDDSMHIIESKKDFEINRIHYFGFPQLLAQNPVYGCTTIMNKALAEKVGTIPPEADFHDHWIALVASALGELCYLKNKTVLYRQHEHNVSGSFDNDSLKKRIRRILINKGNTAEARRKYRMLLCFKKQYGKTLVEKDKKALDNLLCLYEKKKLSCLVKSIRYRVRSQTLPQTVLFYLTAFFTKPSS